MKTNQFLSNIEHNLRGVQFFSVGACPGCDDCGLSENPSDHERDLAEEPSFSWSSCDSCGSTLGGNRHPAHGVIADTMESARGGDITHFSVCVDCLCFHANGYLPETEEEDPEKLYFGYFDGLRGLGIEMTLDKIETAGDVLCEIQDALQCFAPPYCYFGTHQGDGSDFGYWPDHDQIEELPTVEGSDEAAELGEDCKSVNDHGNVTVYSGEGKPVLELV